MIFLACDALGTGGSAVRGFRGPGRFGAPGVDVAADDVGSGTTAGGGAGLSALPSSAQAVELELDASADTASGGREGGDQRGHLVASSEPSSTSTTSLKGVKGRAHGVYERDRCAGMQRRECKAVCERRREVITYVMYLPANKYVLAILTRFTWDDVPPFPFPFPLALEGGVDTDA